MTNVRGVFLDKIFFFVFFITENPFVFLYGSVPFRSSSVLQFIYYDIKRSQRKIGILDCKQFVKEKMTVFNKHGHFVHT